MKPGDTRARAAKTVDAVVRGGKRLEDALGTHVGGSDDAALIRALASGVLRWQVYLEALVAPLLRKPMKARDFDVQALLLVGVFQIEFLRVPDYAAISETVDAVKSLRKEWARGMVNAVLRRFLRERDGLIENCPADARLAHPAWLLGKLRKNWPEHWAAIVEANNSAGPMNLRLNLAALPLDAFEAALGTEGMAISATAKATAQATAQATSTGRAVTAAVRLAAPAPVECLPGFLAGQVSVQDMAAQAAALMLEVDQLDDGGRILDACAAPGGKTGHLLELMGGRDIELVAVEVDAQRAQRIDENLARLQPDKATDRVSVCIGDLGEPESWWDGRGFDRILLDAPCSATGVIRRHPDIKQLRRPEDIDALLIEQARLLDQVWALLRPGGLLLYATCSVLKQENDMQVRAFVERRAAAADLVLEQPVWPFPVDAVEPGLRTDHGLQLFPGGESDEGGEQVGHDGFFYSCLRKRVEALA